MTPSTPVPEVLWQPTAERIERAAVTHFAEFLADREDRDFADYAELWSYSVADLAGFWGAVADYFGVRWHDEPSAVLGEVAMPGADWFPGATLNYAEHALAAADGRLDDDIAVIAADESGGDRLVTLAELRALVGAAQAGLASAGGGGGRPGRRARPEPAGGAGRLPRDGRARRGLVVLFAGLRRTVGDRQVHSDRADGVDRGRRIHLRRQGLRHRRDGRRNPGRTARAGRRGAHRRRWARRRPDGAIGWDELVSDPAEPEYTPGAVLRAAVGAVFIGNHRTAQADRPVGRRDRARTPEDLAAAP